MIPVPSGVRVWLAVGRTDMRRGMNGLALQVQETLKRDPHGGDLYIFRGRRGDLIKVLWHDGLGMSLYAKRLERGRFIWPSPADGIVAITPAQLAYLLDGIDWERRETDERQRVQVPYDEGVASHIGPESCVGGREVARPGPAIGAVGPVAVNASVAPDLAINGGAMAAKPASNHTEAQTNLHQTVQAATLFKHEVAVSRSHGDPRHSEPVSHLVCESKGE